MVERLLPIFNSETNQVDLVVFQYENGEKVDQYTLYSLDALIQYREGFYRDLTDWEVFRDQIESTDEDVLHAEMEIDEKDYQEQLAWKLINSE